MEEKNLTEERSETTCKETKSDKCYLCHESEITFMCLPCRCECLCKKCAMKIATGGKCKICQKFFSGLRKIV
jgi:hypothetical protein